MSSISGILMFTGVISMCNESMASFYTQYSIIPISLFTSVFDHESYHSFLTATIIVILNMNALLEYLHSFYILTWGVKWLYLKMSFQPCYTAFIRSSS